MARDPRLPFHAKSLLIRAIHGNDAPAIACKARGTPRNHAPLAITQAAFEAIASTLPLGSVSYENETNERGERLIWLEWAVVDRLRAMRGDGQSFSDVILRLAAESG
jgi:hypothetical protein